MSGVGCVEDAVTVTFGLSHTSPLVGQLVLRGTLAIARAKVYVTLWVYGGVTWRG